MNVTPESARVACSGYPYIGALACVSSFSICRTLTLTVLPSTYYIHALLNLIIASKAIRQTARRMMMSHANRNLFIASLTVLMQIATVHAQAQRGGR